MRFTDFFIERPVFAVVISLVILLFGVRALEQLPVEQFPHTVSGTIDITTVYYGADPETVAGYITTPLEALVAQAAGVDYITSTSITSVSDITVYLKLNYDPARALAEIQSYVTAATSQFPPGTQASSISLSASTSDILDLSLQSNVLAPERLADVATRLVAPRLQAAPGVQTVQIKGNPSLVMRVWLNPEKLAEYNMTPTTVATALQANNFVSGAGQTLGAMTYRYLEVNSGLHDPAEFRNLVIRSDKNQQIRLRDVAVVALGADPDNLKVISTGKLGVFLSVRPTPAANVLDVSAALNKTVVDIARQLPPGVHLATLYSAGAYIGASIGEVRNTLLQAVGIVAVVIFLFLGSPRALAVPVVTIPLSLIGTLWLMHIAGFSINLLTLLALVLATGLVVDDAIIVAENVNRHLADGHGAKQAAIIAARELAGPILAMTIVLVAAFVPVGTQGGLTGAIFTQFAFTLAGAVAVSAVVAVTLSPVMCAWLAPPPRHLANPSLFDRFEGRIEAGFAHATRLYAAALHITLRLNALVIVFGLAVLTAIAFMLHGVKAELSPREDKGYIIIQGSSAPNATMDQLALYDQRVLSIYKSIPETFAYWHIDEPSATDGGMILKTWEQRSRNVFDVANEVQAKLSRIPGLDFAVYEPPYLPGSWGLPIGFVLQSSGSLSELERISDRFVTTARASGLFSYIDRDLKVDQPQTTIVVDREKLADLGMTMTEIGDSLNTMLGGGFIGFFTNAGRSYKVEPLAQRHFRLTPEQILTYPIAFLNGQSLPLRAVATISNSVVPESISHFQQLTSTTISATLAPNVSQSQAYAYLQSTARKVLPAGFGTDTVGSLRQFVREKSGLFSTFALALVISYLALAALFESFRDPLVILVSVPMSIASALFFIWLGVGGVSLNLFSEVGMVTLLGLISKHGILIVEVARREQERGLARRAALEKACLVRLRPILMTTAAMVLGVLPLLAATGAGAASRFAMGLVIFTGLSIGTLFTLFVLPSFYLVIAGKHSHRHGPAA